MATLFIYRGLQGSGKSTLAAAKAEKDGGRIVGRDKLRALMGFSGIGKPWQENEVTKLQGELIVQGLKSGQNVHVDDMNLKTVYVRRLLSLAELAGAEVEVHDLTNVPLSVCLSRNFERSERNKGFGFVDEHVITKNYEKFVKGKPCPLPMPTTPLADMRAEPPVLYEPDLSKPKAMLVDLDGTVAIKSPYRGYHDYDHRVGWDLPNEPVIEVVKSLSRTLYPIFVSGRKGNDACFNATMNWIHGHLSDDSRPFETYDLFMREAHDNRPDWIIKNEIFDREIRDRWNVVVALDDRDQVVQRYRQLGLTVLQVADGNF